MKALSSFETSVIGYQSTRRNITEDLILSNTAVITGKLVSRTKSVIVIQRVSGNLLWRVAKTRQAFCGPAAIPVLSSRRRSSEQEAFLLISPMSEQFVVRERTY